MILHCHFHHRHQAPRRAAYTPQLLGKMRHVVVILVRFHNCRPLHDISRRQKPAHAPLLSGMKLAMYRYDVSTITNTTTNMWYVVDCKDVRRAVAGAGTAGRNG